VLFVQIQEEMASTPGIKYVEMEDGSVGVELSYNDEPTVMSMEQCVAMMLTKLAKITLEATGSKPGDCVVSVPGWYTDAQRRAMLNACEIAQLHCLRLLHEGTAVALEYGMFKSAKGIFDEKPQHVAFLDLGHGTFSCTIASFVTGKLTVRAASHDRSLGGRDFDKVIARKIAEAFEAKHKADPWANNKARMKLFTAAEKAKKTLSPTGVTEARISCECLMNDIDFNMSLTLDDFVAAAEPLLDRLAPCIMQCLAQSGIPPAEICAVELVGGSTRLGFVKTRMTDILMGAGVPLNRAAVNCGLSTTMNADEAVARGTAWQAALLSTRFRVKEFQILDAVSFPVKLQWEPASGAAAAPEEGGVDGDAAASEGGEDAATVATGATSAVVFQKNEATPNAKKVTFRRSGSFAVTAAYDDAALADLPPGTSPVIDIFTVEVPADVAADSGVPKIRVNVKHTLHGTVEVQSAQLMEEIKEEAKKDEGEAKGMDVDAGAEGKAADEKASEEPPKKKRFRKVELRVTSSGGGMSRARVDAAVEMEVKMDHQDKVIEETNAARNDVEAYIYSQRDEISGALSGFFGPGEKEAQEEALTAAEDWLYSGDGYDSQKSVYIEKPKDLKKKSANAEFRQAEGRNRDACVKTLKASLEEFKNWLISSTDEKFSHISEDDKGIVRTACTDTESWLYAQLEAQAALDQNVDPVLTCDELGVKRRALVDKCKSVMNKPKPKVEAPVPEAKPADDAAPAPEEGKAAEGKEGEDKDAGDGAPTDPAPEDAPAGAEAKEGDAPAVESEEK